MNAVTFRRVDGRIIPMQQRVNTAPAKCAYCPACGIFTLHCVIRNGKCPHCDPAHEINRASRAQRDVEASRTWRSIVE